MEEEAREKRVQCTKYQAPLRGRYLLVIVNVRMLTINECAHATKGMPPHQCHPRLPALCLGTLVLEKKIVPNT